MNNNETKNPRAKMDEESKEVSLDISNIFENFIKPGLFVDEREVVPGLSVRLKSLNTNELMSAEAEINAQNPMIPADIIVKLRGASILSHAIITLNGVEVEKENMTEKDISLRRYALYKKLLEMPTIVIEKMYRFYLEVVATQNKFFDFPDRLGKEIENF